jgi:hypothetical protein
MQASDQIVTIETFTGACQIMPWHVNIHAVLMINQLQNFRLDKAQIAGLLKVLRGRNWLFNQYNWNNGKDRTYDIQYLMLHARIERGYAIVGAKDGMMGEAIVRLTDDGRKTLATVLEDLLKRGE